MASSCTEPGATDRTMSNTLRTLISIVMNTTVSTGREQGHGHAPEDLPLAGAVRARGLEHVARDGGEAGGDHHHREAGPDPDVGDDHRGGDQLGAEPGDTVERLGERRRPDGRACTRRPRRRRRRSCRRRLGHRRLDRVAVGVAQLDGHAGHAELLRLDLARRAAAGLEVPPDDAHDRALQRLWGDRLHRARRHLVRRDAGEARAAPSRRPATAARRARTPPGRCP